MFCLACRRECHTRNHSRRHLQGQQSTQCIRTIAFWFPDPTGQQRTIDQNVQESLRGHDRQQAEARPKYHTFGPRLPAPSKDWRMPPVHTGYVTKAHTQAILPQEDLADDVVPLTPEQIISDHSSHNISEFTLHLGPTRVILLFYGGRRRPGDKADHAERQIPCRHGWHSSLCCSSRHCSRLSPRYPTRCCHLLVSAVHWWQRGSFRCCTSLRDLVSRQVDRVCASPVRTICTSGRGAPQQKAPCATKNRRPPLGQDRPHTEGAQTGQNSQRPSHLHHCLCHTCLLLWHRSMGRAPRPLAQAPDAWGSLHLEA